MSTYLDSFKGFNMFSKQMIVYALITCAFWTVPFCLFKPEFFKFPIYVQIAVIFSLSSAWYVLTMLSIIRYLYELNDYPMSITILTGVSAFLLCVAILISYYYSSSFTFFLRVAFLWVMVPVFLWQFVRMFRTEWRRVRGTQVTQP
ncbi:hypothetical protein [Flavobacterium sp. ABG]|uniref:hypothetical protein n=1 Tax=Flavobacterium sp. ABG TaxID=1423322 RepID=UPI00064AD6DE|nr:hypothetical protein [Flavobacterium sp. ABG]KLT69909.1 hypothetical protein AB674_09400 [Flavobacterium sp. ABG]